MFKILALAFSLSAPSELPDFADWLSIHSCPCADQFAVISYVETQLGNTGVGVQHNLFGMGARPNYTQAYGSAVYASDLESVYDLRKWISKYPPYEGESFVGYLNRRKWNPYQSYYLHLQEHFSIVNASCL